MKNTNILEYYFINSFNLHYFLLLYIYYYFT